jgi:hypothetical protein
MDAVVERLLCALRSRDGEQVRLALHPYVRWELADGRTVYGRRRVLAMLADASLPDAPSSIELRDGQIYRWA